MFEGVGFGKPQRQFAVEPCSSTMETGMFFAADGGYNRLCKSTTLQVRHCLRSAVESFSAEEHHDTFTTFCWPCILVSIKQLNILYQISS